MATKKALLKSPTKGSPKSKQRVALSTSVSNEDLTTGVHPRIAFIRSVKFVGLGIDKASSTLDRIALAKARQHEAALELDLKINQSVLSHADDHFVVKAEFELIQTSKESAKPILFISATFSARFNLLAPANADLVQAFSGVEARLIFFPYIRHFVSDMTYRMTNEPIVLPMTSELER